MVFIEKTYSLGPYKRKNTRNMSNAENQVYNLVIIERDFPFLLIIILEEGGFNICKRLKSDTFTDKSNNTWSNQ